MHSCNRPKRLAVFASGHGSNLRNIVEHIESGRLRDVSLALVLSNRSRSGALEFAAAAGLPHVYYSSLSCPGGPSGFESGMVEVLRQHQIDLIMLAGYLKKLPDEIVRTYAGRILNVHPALLPSFGGASMYGDKVHEAVLARGCKVSGATVHLVTEEYDAGPIVAQKCCPVFDTDSIEDLRQRVGAVELEIVPQAIDHLAHGRLQQVQQRVYISD